MKINKIKMLISSILIIIPTLICALFADKIDGQMAIHYGIDGNADGFASPLFFIAISSLSLIVIQWICVLITKITNDKVEQSKKVIEIIYWICPAISFYISAIMISVSLGTDINIIALSSAPFGLMFIVIGNYMPKCKRNSTMGIKIRWTLTNEENWNTTHRFAGKLWFVCGVVVLFCGFLPMKLAIAAFMIILFASIIMPIICSYNNYRTQIKEGRATKDDFKFPKQSKAKTIITTVLVIFILVFVTVLMIVGDVTTTLTDTSLLIESTYYSDLSISLNDIKSIEYTSNLDAVRISGFGSPRLSLGLFKSEKFGTISCYCYTQNEFAVIIKTGNNSVIAVNCADEAQTRALYDSLVDKTGKGQ